ncbi:MAG: hypothetical protein A3D10_00115 [Omnitrophica WOR_2 bacterium RIFCSPHIGHO2_02_FULL_48_11]|nr:MAG: hypothetical protein A3D10_00115 [Omnitrophica WOR_2 bacterium RIFCSPHIGHO2_02_FULL_48_11]
MRPEWLWDKNISSEEIKKILKDPRHERFLNIAALLLSRNNTPREVFARYLDQKIFVQNWARIKRQMRKDAWNDPRIIFWQAVYEKLGAEFMAKGIALRPAKMEEPADQLIRTIAEKVKLCRRSLGLTQGELAEKIGISQQIISRVEKGRNDIRLLTLEKIFNFLGEQIIIDSRPSWIERRISHA